MRLFQPENALKAFGGGLHPDPLMELIILPEAPQLEGVKVGTSEGRQTDRNRGGRGDSGRRGGTGGGGREGTGRKGRKGEEKRKGRGRRSRPHGHLKKSAPMVELS